MQYAIVLFIETREKPDQIRDELVSNLEFECASVVNHLVVLKPNGKTTAVYDRRERNNDRQDHTKRPGESSRKTGGR